MNFENVHTPGVDLWLTPKMTKKNLTYMYHVHLKQYKFSLVASENNYCRCRKRIQIMIEKKKQYTFHLIYFLT